MALKDTWTPKTEFIDDATAADINEVAAAVIKIEKEGASGGGGMTEAELIEWLRNSIVYANAISTNFVGVPSWAAIVLSNSGITLDEVLNGKVTEEQVREILVEYLSDSVTAKELIVSMLLSSPAIHLLADTWNNIVKRDKNGNSVTLEQTLATKSDKMVLLNTFTVNDGDEYSNIVFSQTDDGLSYANIPLRNIRIYTETVFDGSLTKAQSTAIQLEFRGTEDWRNFVSGATIDTSVKKWAQAILRMDDKRVQITTSTNMGYAGTVTENNLMNYSGSPIYVGSYGGQNPIHSIRWTTNSETVFFKPGTKIEIWGCR